MNTNNKKGKKKIKNNIVNTDEFKFDEAQLSKLK